jgi:hypothetical protein
MASLSLCSFATTGTKRSSQSSTPLCYLISKRESFLWMTNGRRFHIKLTQFAELLRSSSHLAIHKKLHTGRVMALREMTHMYILNSEFCAPRIDGILPHFVVLHRMMMRTLVLRIGNSNAIPAYERNLLDALMNFEW